MVDSPAPEGRSGTEVRSGLLWFLLVAVAIVLALRGFIVLDVGGRELIDTDGYMRTLRAVELADGSSGWFDGEVSRSNAPFGHQMHWTRPMDALLIGAGALWAAAGMSARDAVYWGSVIVGPVLMLVIGLTVAWASVPLIGRRRAPLAGAIAIAQPALLSYTAAGRSDHHALILVSAAIAAGSLIRLIAGDQRRTIPLVGGLAMAFGIWASVEAMFVVGVGGLVLGLAWACHTVIGRQATRLWLSAALSLAFFLVLERGMESATLEFDRLSIVHVALLALGVVAWVGATVVGGSLGSPAGRVGVLAAVGTVTLGLATALFPALLEGPFGGVSVELETRWLARVAELRPIFSRAPALAAALLLGPAVGLLLAVRRWSQSEGSERSGWFFLVLWMSAGFGLSLMQLRWVMYPQLLAGIALAAYVAAALDWLETRERLLRLAAAGVVLVVALFGWLVPLLLPSGSVSTRDNCSVGNLDQSSVGSGVMLAAIDHGPEILWRTDARVVSTPHHRNVDGILDTLDAFEGNEQVAKAIVDERGVDVVAVCPTVDGKDYPNAGPQSLFTRLVDGHPPVWLDLTAGPGDAGGFLVFRVVR